MNRIEAQRAGYKFYDAHKRCIHGHSSLRYVSSGSCVDCCKQNNALQRKRDAKKSAEQRAAALTLKRDIVRLSVDVHYLSYTGMFAAIQAINAVMGLPPELNTPDYLPSPVDGALTRAEVVRDWERVQAGGRRQAHRK